jgi:2-dehydropantoate 2-reductase
VPFNVVWAAAGHFHRGVEGDLILEAGVTELSDILSVDGLVAKTATDINAVLWGKILLNLNNALNALSDVPLKAQLSKRGWRKILAGCQAEALKAMKSAGISPHTELPVPLTLMPTILRLPDFLFERVAAKMLAIDENARSSMWEDLTRGRKTEIADLQGEIVELAKKHNTPAPLNLRVWKSIQQAEEAQSGSPRLRPSDIAD